MEEDFNREVWCLLGLPFDAVTMECASVQVRRSVATGQQCVISTPNLNFVVSALGDSEFRNSVIDGELSLLDGTPLLWIARLLGLGVTEKVSGSDLFDYMSRRTKSESGKFSVFFFGGEGETAQLACENLNTGKKGVTCAGYLNPGFGPIEALSSPEVIKQINQSQADFLIAALGAKKGQFWITRNRSTLNIPVICHLGAVINFSAGSVRRAPRWMQQSGLEWIWRIAQEPNLWRRYWFDGLIFLSLVFTKVLPYALWNKINRKEYLGDLRPVEVKVDAGPEKATISISGNCLHDTIEPLRAVFVEQAGGLKNVVVDLSAVSMIDGAFLGLCLMLCKQVNRVGGKLSFSGLNSKVTQIFRWNCVEFLL